MHKLSVGNHVEHKEATNQSLNQKSRCFYIGAFSFNAILMVATLAHAADQHLHLFDHIPPWKFDRRDSYIFKAYRSAACVTNKVNVIIMVLPTGTVVFA